MGRGDPHTSIEREQQRRAVSNGGRGREISAERRTVADQRRREEVAPFTPDRVRDVDLAQGAGGADLDRVVGLDVLEQFGDGLYADEIWIASKAEIRFDAEVGPAGDQAGAGMARHLVEAFGE